MKKVFCIATAALLLGLIAGCQGGDVSQSGATDKYNEIEKQTKDAGGTPQKADQ
jgi:hypothetical protein